MKSLATNAQDLLHVLVEFAGCNNVTTEVKLTMVDDELQKINASTCGNFKLYFYKNLFDPEKNSTVQYHEKLTKKTIDLIK